ncbi:hypothetical protein MACJ_002032 [Theileria orientalis]|uniref:FYVE-type domain-containing protein n=1 Tax=Theileria orientalis TaxID=68886 RepID=A0A976QQA3_THEOR|nr:hypothetical protein MACJ_002032 [Theileria orientalis]
MYIIYNNITDEFKNYRNIQKSQIHPRRKRISEAIRTKNFEDIRSLLDIHFIDDATSNCDICGHLLNSGFFNYKPKFSCQLCNETFCRDCKYEISLFKGSKVHKPIVVSSCRDCYVYYRRLLFLVEDKNPEDTNLMNVFNHYKAVLEIYKDLNTKLLQLKGYLKLLTIHNMLKPLPEGTKISIIQLLKETTNSKKQLSNIKAELKGQSSSEPSIVTSHVIKSLNTLLTSILYKIVPEFNSLKNKLESFEENKQR